jgi:choline dehydrogenase
MPYDVVIVGAGSAGCLLAERLSADPARRVMLLEAGGRDNKLEVRIPAAFYKLFKSKVDWAFSTEPQAHLDGRRLFVPRGKMLGGSSSINAMIYIRGHRKDYDGWAVAAGPEWSYDAVLPFFRKSEGHERGGDAHHGAGGPLNVADLRLVNPLTYAFLEAAESLGIPRNDDFNGTGQEGVGCYQVTQKNGGRWSAADAFLRPALSRPNLQVETGAQTTRVLFDGRRATGVEYVRNGRSRHVAAGQVILSAGAIGSPQLLMLSGIGPADELARHRIAVVADSPGVGGNLQDHAVCGVATASTQPVSLDTAETIGNLLRFLLKRQGPLTSNVAEAGGFVRTRPELDAPDLQFHFAPCWFVDHGFVKPPGSGYSVGATLITPKSRGRITLRSSDPYAAPMIDGNFFSEDDDMTTMLAGIRLSRRIARAAAFDAWRGGEYLPGDGAQSDDELRAHVRATCEMLYHPAGTCRMGSDEASVVDPHLRVRGVDNLSVIDASVMPTIVRGNTNAPTMMIAERAISWL